MAQPKLTTYQIVWISFNADSDVKFPYLPGDGHGLVLDFHKWCAAVRIVSPVGGGMSGGGRLEQGFFLSDMPTIIEWWRARGVEIEGPWDRWAAPSSEGVAPAGDAEAKATAHRLIPALIEAFEAACCMGSAISGQTALRALINNVTAHGAPPGVGLPRLPSGAPIELQQLHAQLVALWSRS